MAAADILEQIEKSDEIALMRYDPKLLYSPFGLSNFGSVCYFNSALQALLSTTAFTKCILQNREYLSRSKVGTQLHALVNTINRLDLKEINSLGSAHKLLYDTIIEEANRLIPGTSCKRQQDGAHEIIRWILTLVEDRTTPEYQDSSIGKYISDRSLFNPLYQCFMSKYQKFFKCASCSAAVELDSVDYVITKSLYNERPKTAEEYSEIIKRQTEIIKDYNCPSCKVKSRGTLIRAMTIAPEIIILDLNVIQSLGGQRSAPIIPKMLKINKLNYKLSALIEHMGSNDGGHYTAQRLIKKYNVDGTFIESVADINDGTFTICNDFISTRNIAYIFYQFADENSEIDVKMSKLALE